MQPGLASIWGDAVRAFTTWQFDLLIVAALVLGMILHRVLPRSATGKFPVDLALSLAVTVAIGWAVFPTLTDATTQANYARAMEWVTILTAVAVLIVWWLRSRKSKPSTPPVDDSLGGVPMAMLQFIFKQLQDKEHELTELRRKSHGPPWQDLMMDASREAADAGDSRMDALGRERDAAIEARGKAQAELATVRDALNAQEAAAKALHDEVRDRRNEAASEAAGAREVSRSFERRLLEAQLEVLELQRVIGHAEQARQQAQEERDSALAEVEAVKEQMKPKTLRQAAFQLASEIRDQIRMVPTGLSRDEEFSITFDDFSTRFWDRYAHIKDRMMLALPPFTAVSAAEWLHGGKDNLQKIADNLDVEGQRVAEDFLL